MVDPTKGIGSVQNLISGTRVSDSVATKKETKEATFKDNVELSSKAIGLSEAKDVSEKVSSLLKQDTSQSLTTGRIFDESL